MPNTPSEGMPVIARFETATKETEVSQKEIVELLVMLWEHADGAGIRNVFTAYEGFVGRCAVDEDGNDGKRDPRREMDYFSHVADYLREGYGWKKAVTLASRETGRTGLIRTFFRKVTGYEPTRY